MTLRVVKLTGNVPYSLKLKYLASLDPSGEVHWFGHPGSSVVPEESLD